MHQIQGLAVRPCSVYIDQHDLTPVPLHKKCESRNPPDLPAPMIPMRWMLNISFPLASSR